MKSIRTRLLLALIGLIHLNTAQAEIFKYQDEQGKWHFTDKQPDSSQTSKLETLTYSKTSQKSNRPYIEVINADQHFEYWAHNPFHAPVETFLRFDDEPDKRIRIVLDPLESRVMARSPSAQAKRLFHFRYVIGDPQAETAIKEVHPPFTDYRPMQITQAFNGRFSHNRQPSVYAVDISMPVGTKIIAAKSGIVISTKDDYHAAGVTSGFFYDKANYVDILHDDGSYAIYGHLLLGGVKVKAGEHVKAGQVIALSGNTGFSTGPHLHFAIRHNAQGQSKSLSFKFLQANKQNLLPEAGLWLLPYAP